MTAKSILQNFEILKSNKHTLIFAQTENNDNKEYYGNHKRTI